MKPYISILVTFLVTCFSLQGQDFRNLINPGTAYYTGLNGQPGFLSGIKADSVFATGGGDTLFLAANTMRPMTPPGDEEILL